jgi:ferrous iron transport protein B
MTDRLVIALAGNPNSGKSTLFNALTGARQHVGNYPGVTVERKEGTLVHDGQTLQIVDLPGTYSLTAYSVEERVARDLLVNERPDVVVDVVDASNLERNLYLTTQLIELEQPTVVALNMVDMAERRGKQVDTELLGTLLGVPVVATVAARGKGMEQLLDTAVTVAREHRHPAVRVALGTELEEHIAQIEARLAAEGVSRDAAPHLDPRWIATKLLEGDAEVLRHATVAARDPEGLRDLVARVRAHLEAVTGEDAEIAIADRRYGFAAGAVREAQQHRQQSRLDWTEAVDRVVVSRALGLPIFILLMWAMFQFVFRAGAAPMAWTQAFFDWLGGALWAQLPAGELRSLLVEGVIDGVGGVLVFVPNLVLLFLAISLLEDSGYLARAAFVVDRVMHRVGLHGKSFIPLLLGLGCGVPAVLATRTLDARRDRIVTMIVSPLMSCGARLPIYLLLTGAFFRPEIAGHVIFSIYALGGVAAMGMAALFRRYLLTGPTTPFVMELPPYRVPTARGLAIHVWERTWHYVKKAGTVILAFAVVVWALMTYPRLPQERLQGLSPEQASAASLEHSVAGRFGRVVEPLVRPLGFSASVAVALAAGVGAKEVVVSTLATAHAMSMQNAEGADLRDALRSDPNLSPLIAYALMVFVLMYVPCLSVLTVIWRESGSWKWPVFTIAYTCALAWLMAFAVYQGGRLLGLG